jgi:hypothetical protein
MNAPARIVREDDPVDTIVVALARALARQHHAESQAEKPRQDRTRSS